MLLCLKNVVLFGFAFLPSKGYSLLEVLALGTSGRSLSSALGHPAKHTGRCTAASSRFPLWEMTAR